MVNVPDKPSYVNLPPYLIKFAREFVATGQWQKAYHKTGLNAKSLKDRRNIVWRWLHRPDVSQYIMELYQMASEKAAISAADILSNFEKIRDAAFDCGDYGNANKANEHLGKSLGLFIEKSEQKIEHTHRNSDELDEEIARLQNLLGDDTE